MKVLFIGDIFGSPGRKMVQDHLPHVVETHKADLVIANAENAAGGFGLTPSIAEDLFDLGCHVLTTGNHVWDKREIMDYMTAANGNPGARATRVLRPANYSQSVPGKGVFEGVTQSGHGYAVINLQGRVFMHNADDPFRKVEELLKQIASKVVLLDFHAEATSEKIAMGWHLDGRVTAVLGTHTHVPTADTRILPQGTAYQTDVGMTGPFDGVIGVQKEQIIHRFLTGLPSRFEAAKGDPRFCAVLIDCDPETGRAHSIQRLMLGE
ncbi:MAG TPA: TIGR00282 family metallophosphoesterase [Candidatus Saccharimonadales bacterium]|nr:TIGR00282 family metallophosphoesterase [Candidatus Saccharimonadales bacterium]